MAFKTKNFADIVNSVVAHLTANNQNITDLNIGSVIRSLVEGYALELDDVTNNGLYQQIQAVYDATRISTATATDLDELVSLVGVTRNPGSKSTGNLTLQRTTPALADFTVPVNSLFSIQPAGITNVLRFTSDSDIIFNKNIAAESHSFADGIYEYPLTQRFYDNVTSIAGTVATVPHTFSLTTDYLLTKNVVNKTIIDLPTIASVDTAEATTGWAVSTSAAALTTDTVNFRQGTKSLKLGKSGITTDTLKYTKTISTSVDLTGKSFSFWLRIQDAATLAKILTSYYRLGSSSSNYIEWNLSNASLSTGWNLITLNTANATTVGTPDVTSITFMEFDFRTNNVTDIITSGLINIDYMFFSNTIAYNGDIITFVPTGTLPDNGTNFLVDYVPLSVEVPITAELVGVQYNVIPGKVTYMVSSIPDIVSVNNYSLLAGGTDIETDTALRNRVLNTSFSTGKATTSAIQSAVIALPYVTSAVVDDMPTFTATNEAHTYTTGTSLYALAQDFGQVDSTLTLVDATNSTLNGALNGTATTITITSTTSYATSGFIKIDNEVISYTGKTGTTLTGCIRGVEGTTATTHLTAAAAQQWYKPSVDYNITDINEIQFLTAYHPANTKVFNVTYNWRQVGHISLFIGGTSTFSAAQQTEIDTTIDANKAAGIFRTWTTPTIVNVNVTASINIKTGYTYATVRDAVIAALTLKLNSYPIGTSVYVSQLIDTIMLVPGVNYTNVTTPAGTTTITTSQQPKSGTLLISQV